MYFYNYLYFALRFLSYYMINVNNDINVWLAFHINMFYSFYFMFPTLIPVSLHGYNYLNNKLHLPLRKSCSMSRCNC